MSSFWDNLMRKKGLFLFLVAIFSVVSLSSYNILYGVTNHSKSSNSIDDLNIAEKPSSGYQNYLRFTVESGLEMTFAKNFTGVSVSTNHSELKNPASLKILDKSGQVLASEETILVQSNSSMAESLPTYTFAQSKNYTVSLKPGYQIVISSPDTKVFSTLSGKLATSFLPQNTTETYSVTDFGIMKSGWDTKRAQTEMYNILCDYFSSALTEYQNTTPKEVLYNKNLDAKSKSQALVAFYQLREADQAPFQELVRAIKQGGSPEIKYFGELEYEKGKKLDLGSLVSVFDAEDGQIERVTVTTNLDFNRPGTYNVTYSAYDSDQNRTDFTVKITVKETSTSATPVKPSQPSSNGQIAEGWGAIGSLLPNSIATMGSGNNASSSSNSTAEEPEATDDDLENEQPVDLADGSLKPSNDHQASPSAPTTESTTERKSHGLKAWQICLAAVGVLVILGLIRFISDHYVR